MKKNSSPSFVTRIHILASSIGMLVILSFWSSTLLVELLGSIEQVVLVKRAIPWGLFVLVPAMAIAGISGSKLARGRQVGLFAVKLRRMKIVAANGLLILVPAALFLASKATAGDLDGAFYVVQGLELLAGATNLTLMSFNVRDGRKLSGKK